MNYFTDKFAWVDWMISQRKNLGWSQATLANKTGLSRTAISQYEKRMRPNPDDAALSKIAVAFGFPPEQVLRIANKLPPEPKEDPLVRVITYLAEKLPTKEDKQDAEQYLRLRLRIAEERGKYESANKKRAEKT